MADEKPRVCLTNLRAQPVELHLGPTVHVLAAGQGVEIDASALSLPQVKYLLDRKAIASRALPVAKADIASGTESTPRRRGKGAAKTKTLARSPQSSKRKKGS